MPLPRRHVGRFLFGVYLVCYGTFVLVNAFAPGLTEPTPVAGLNVAVLAGFGLIVLAVVMALLYGWLAPTAEQTSDEDTADTGDAT